jgi:hypothetical protein
MVHRPATVAADPPLCGAASIDGETTSAAASTLPIILFIDFAPCQALGSGVWVPEAPGFCQSPEPGTPVYSSGPESALNALFICGSGSAAL